MSQCWRAAAAIRSLAAAEDARRLGAADRLAAGEDDQVGPVREEAAEVRRRGEFRRRVDEHRDAATMRELADGGQVERAEAGREGDRGGPRGEGGLDLPGGRLGEADLDQPGPDGPECVVVARAVRPGDDDLVGDVAGVGQPLHPRQVEARQAGGHAEHQPPRGAVGDVSRLGAGMPRDDAAGGLLELVDPDQGGGRLGHRRDHLGAHPRTPQPRQRPGRVDDRPDAQPLVDGPHDEGASFVFESKGQGHAGTCVDLRLRVRRDQWSATPGFLRTKVGSLIFRGGRIV